MTNSKISDIAVDIKKMIYSFPEELNNQPLLFQAVLLYTETLKELLNAENTS